MIRLKYPFLLIRCKGNRGRLTQRTVTSKESSKKERKKQRRIKKRKAGNPRVPRVAMMYLMKTRTPNSITVRRQILLWMERGREFPHSVPTTQSGIWPGASKFVSMRLQNPFEF